MRWLWKEEKEDGLKKSDREMPSFLFHRIEIEGEHLSQSYVVAKRVDFNWFCLLMIILNLNMCSKGPRVKLHRQNICCNHHYTESLQIWVWNNAPQVSRAYLHSSTQHILFWVQPFWLPHGNLGSMQQPYVPKESMYQTGPSLVTWYIDPETWSHYHFQCTSYVIVIVTVIVIWPKGSHAINLRVLTRDIESSKITIPVPTS